MHADPLPRTSGDSTASASASRAAGSPGSAEKRVRPSVNALAIELTASCNQKCDYCYNEWRDNDGKSVETGDVAKLLARVKKLADAWDLDHVTLTGGEPFSHAGVFPLLDEMRARGIGVQMISNGGLITDAIAERLRPYHLRYIQITLNGHTEELHAAHVGDGHYERTLRGIRALKKAGVPVVGCIVVTRRNARHVGEILRVWKELGATQVALSRFSPAGYAAKYAAELLPSRDDLLCAFEQALPFARSGMNLSCTMPVPPCAIETREYAPISFGGCAIGTSMQEFALSPAGTLRNCTLHKTPLGNVQDVLAEDVDPVALLSAPEVTEYRKQTPEFCHGCVHEQSCAGGCGAAAEWVMGHARRYVDPFVGQYVDDDLALRLETARRLEIARGDGRRHLELVL